MDRTAGQLIEQLRALSTRLSVLERRDQGAEAKAGAVAFNAVNFADLPPAPRVGEAYLVDDAAISPALAKAIAVWDGSQWVSAGGSGGSIITPISLSDGGTGADLSGAGPGALVQTALGAVVSVETLAETRGGTGRGAYSKGDLLAATGAAALGVFAVPANGDIIIADSAQATGWDNGDHGDINGLGDDDHTQYALLVGRAGGQTLYGGTGSGDNLTVESTSHGTKGFATINATGGLVRVWNHQFLEPSLEVNAYGVGNRYAYIDLHGDDTYTDFGLRILRRNAGPNTNSDIIHRGTGCLRIISQEAGEIRFYTTNTQRAVITSAGRVGIGTPSPIAQLHVDQSLGAGAQPVLLLDQGDVDEPFIRFDGTAASGDTSRNIIKVADGTFAAVGWLMIEINDLGNQVTDGDYYIEFGTVA